MRIEVLPTVWAADGQAFPGGIHTIEKPTRKLLKLVAAAEAAGVLNVTASKDERAAMKGHVETDAVSVKARADAQKSGEWYEGNVTQYVHDVKAGIRKHFGPEIDPQTYVDDRRGVTDG